MSAGVYEIPQINSILLSLILKELGDVIRKVAITIKNKSTQTLENPEVYFEFGNSDYGIPMAPVLNGEGLVWGAHKSAYSLRGTQGIIVYHIKDYNKCLACMWEVPYVYSNKWSVKVYDSFVKPDKDLYEKMRYESHLADGNRYEGTLNGSWRYKGTMGNSGTPTLKIEFQNCSSMSKTG